MPEKRKFIVETESKYIARWKGVYKTYILFREEDVKEIMPPKTGEEKKEDDKNGSAKKY